MIKMLISVII